MKEFKTKKLKTKSNKKVTKREQVLENKKS